MTKKTEAIENVEKAINEYKKVEKEEQQTITKGDIQKLIEQMNGMNQPLPQLQTVTQQEQKPFSNEKQIALQIWKDQKTMAIVCIIAITFPTISVLIAMMDLVSLAFVVVLIGIIYPCVAFVKSISVQARLHHKYGLKPLLQFQPQIQTQQNKMQKPQQQNMNKRRIM